MSVGVERLRGRAWPFAPGSWPLLLSLAAWVSMAPHMAAALLPAAPGPACACHIDHTHGVVVGPIVDALGWARNSAGAEALQRAWSWVVMAAAMMVPASYPILRELWGRAFPSQRLLLVGAFVGAFLSGWAIPGVLVAIPGVFGGITGFVPVAMLMTVSAAWYFFPARRWLHAVGHRRIGLSGRTSTAVVQAAGQGLLAAFACALTCLPWMVACAASNHHPALMIGGATAIGYEQFGTQPKPQQLAGLAGLSLVLWTALSALVE